MAKKEEQVKVTICTDGKFCGDVCSFLDEEYAEFSDTGQAMANCTLYDDMVLVERDGREYDVRYERCLECIEATKRRKKRMNNEQTTGRKRN